MLKIGFFGAGKMAQALAKGFLTAGLVKGENITASCSPQDTQCVKAFEGFGSTVTFDNRSVADNADVLLLAVKPTVVKTVLDQIRPNFSSSRHLLLSVAMGVTVNQLEKVRTLFFSSRNCRDYYYIISSDSSDLPCI